MQSISFYKRKPVSQRTYEIILSNKKHHVKRKPQSSANLLGELLSRSEEENLL
jgi:hypothetical protein